MKLIASLRDWLLQRAENLLALLLVSMFSTFLLQILFRYFLNLPVGWTVEWVTVAWLWGILFGYAFVLRESEIIRLDFIYLALPRNYRRAMDIISGLTLAGIFAWTLPASWDYIDFMKIERTAYMRVPFSYVFVVYVPFALSVIIRSLLMVWAGVTGSGRRFDTQSEAESHEYD